MCAQSLSNLLSVLHWSIYIYIYIPICLISPKVGVWGGRSTWGSPPQDRYCTMIAAAGLMQLLPETSVYIYIYIYIL